MAEVDFGIFDADNHYYEALDAFTRHLDPALRKRHAVQWAELDGKPRLIVAGKVNRFIPNPTFDPVARPGSLDDYFRGKRAGDDIRAAFGELDPISPAYRDRDARLALMDDQGIDGCFMFPTLGVGMEESMKDDPAIVHGAFEAFNRWLDEDWGFAYRERIYAAPMLSLIDVDRAIAELEWAIAHDVRIICMRSAPVMAPSGWRSPADPSHDPFWARVNEAGITLALHSGDSGYGRYAADWGSGAEMEAFRVDPFRNITGSDRPPYDMIAALICHGLFARFPNVRVATIESGSNWVPYLVKNMQKVYAQVPSAFAGGDPVEQLREHVWISPYYEDDIRGLADLIGTEHVLMGSDFPHAEGLAEPAAFVKELDHFTQDEARLIMRENAQALAQPQTR
jgi:predicted TIM-barrel fold metal-dependent hydrolase